MNFYDSQSNGIENDLNDNLALEEILRKYQDMKKNFTDAQKQIEKMVKEIQSLQCIQIIMKGQKECLEKEIKELKAIKTQQPIRKNDGSHTRTHETTPYMKVHPSMPSIFSRTFDTNLNVQSTKRRVINGFVTQLTQELQQSQELLFKQRRMLEETRKNLQICNEELSQQRIKNRSLQSEVHIIISENKHLRLELDNVRTERGVLERQLTSKLYQLKRYENLLIKAEDLQGQLDLMDRIYHQIERELEVDCQ